jgi:hypothetical protein
MDVVILFFVGIPFVVFLFVLSVLHFVLIGYLLIVLIIIIVHHHLFVIFVRFVTS